MLPRSCRTPACWRSGPWLHWRSGIFFTRKATVKLPRTGELRCPRTQWGAVTDLFFHMMMWACSVCACLSTKGAVAFTRIPESKLDQLTEGNDELRRFWHQSWPHLSSWASEMEIHNHNNSCNQYSGNRSLICDLFQDTGDNIRMFNIEQGARIAKFEGDKQYVAKCLVICFCSWSLKYFKQLKKNVHFGNVPLHGEVIIRNHSSF